MPRGWLGIALNCQRVCPLTFIQLFISSFFFFFFSSFFFFKCSGFSYLIRRSSGIYHRLNCCGMSLFVDLIFGSPIFFSFYVIKKPGLIHQFCLRKCVCVLLFGLKLDS